MTDEQMREAVENLFSQITDEQRRRAIEKLTKGRPLDEYFTDIVLGVAESELMDYRSFTERVKHDYLDYDDEFLSGWVVLTREALRNTLRLVVRDAIGMTDTLDPVRDIVRDMGLHPEDPPVPSYSETRENISLSDIVGEGQEIPSEEQLNKERQERVINERLWVLWNRIKDLRREAESLSGLMRYHSGSRLSQVVDVLTQAENLTDETMSLRTKETPSEDFRIIDRGESVEIWDDSVGVGIGFRKGDEDSRRRYLSIRSRRFLTGYEDEEEEGPVQRLLSFAEERFPQEFRIRVEEEGKTRTIWDESVGIGIRFEIGDRLARHHLTDIVRDRDLLTTDEGRRLLNETRERLLSFAENRFEEFSPDID